MFHRWTIPIPLEGGGGKGSSVDVEGSPVSQLDVRRTRFLDALVGASPDRLAPMPPNRISTPGVIVVRPDQEVEALLGKLEVGA